MAARPPTTLSRPLTINHLPKLHSDSHISFSSSTSLSYIFIHDAAARRLVTTVSRFSLPIISCSTSSTSTPTPTPSTTGRGPLNRHWMVCMEAPPPTRLNSKSQVIDYYVDTLESVLDSEMEAQVSIYHASHNEQFGFCCDIDEQACRQLARVPGVLLVRPDPDYYSSVKDYSSNITSSLHQNQSEVLFPLGNTKHWLVRVNKPGDGAVTKAQMVDYYAQILTKVMGNEKDAQMCIYDVSWQSDFCFCCEIDEECARELAGLNGVSSVQLDENFVSNNKNYGGNNLINSISPPDSSEEASQAVSIDTKKLFIAGLSFYTSEKTLRAAFEGFGEIVEVKIIMDKISKRSKGYAFVEYTTEEAASTALKEMNGKIINGWMIVVDVAKITPTRNNMQRQEAGRMKNNPRNN